MAKTKSVGSVKKTVNIIGKRLGLKKFGGEFVKPGDILVRQRGTTFHAGKNVGIGKDYTLFSKIAGTVSFRRLTGDKRTKRAIDIVPVEESSK